MILHPLVVHFPIALLIASVGLSWAALRWPSLRPLSWPLLLLGTITALPAVVTGLIEHRPYEETPLHEVIELHQLSSFAVTLLFVALTIWRWRVRRRGADLDNRMLYLVAGLLGVALMIYVGWSGGNLVYDHGINVQR